MVRLFWTSELTPLQGLTVSVRGEKDDSRNDIRRLDFGDAVTKAELERKYGSRPVE